jgi:hypothetical protein
MAALVAALLAGCNSHDEHDSRSASATPNSSPVEQPSALPTAVPFTGTPSLLADRVIKEFDIGNVGWMAAGAGSVWAKTDLSHLVERIDPATNKIVASIPAWPDPVDDGGPDYCQGLGADDNAVWACISGSRIARIDPKTNQIAAIVDVHKTSDQGQIPVRFGHAWVLIGDGSTLVGVADDKVDVTIPLGTRCDELTASATGIWAACPIDGLAVGVDPVSATVTRRALGLADARSISAADQVWVGFHDGVARVDDATGAVTAVAAAYPASDSSLFATPEAVWVRASDDFLRKVDPATAEVTELLTRKGRNEGEALVAFGSIWATAYHDGVLFRISLS